MDEGIAGYVSYTELLESEYRGDVQAWHELQLEIVRKAIADGTWMSIGSILTKKNWEDAEVAKPGLALAEAYVIVTYLASEYGLDKCVSIYKAVTEKGAEGALSSGIQLNFGQLEIAVKAWLEEMASAPSGTGT